VAKRWRNYTDIPDKEARAIYAAVCPPSLTSHDVEIKNNAGQGRGRAYTKGSGYHSTARPFVVVSIPKTETAARHRRHTEGKGGYLPVVLGSRRETLVYILAHELRHLWQAKAKGKPRGMIYGARGRLSERDACAYGMQMLRRYRRGEF
jgi:hypothetical protein